MDIERDFQLCRIVIRRPSPETASLCSRQSRFISRQDFRAGMLFHKAQPKRRTKATQEIVSISDIKRRGDEGGANSGLIRFGIARFANRRMIPLSAVILASVFSLGSMPTSAAPLSAHAFALAAQKCAPSISPSVLRAVAAVESRFEPFAIRDNTTHTTMDPTSHAAATQRAEVLLGEGHSIDIGLMQINSANLASLDLGVAEAFDACRSLDAAGRILLNAFGMGSTETERQAAMLITLSRYNTGRALAGISNGYADQVIAAQAAVLNGEHAQLRKPSTPQWDIWASSGLASAGWVITADHSSQIERAGAQTSDARNEGRAPASSSEKGEPYEVFAYQESKTDKP